MGSSQSRSVEEQSDGFEGAAATLGGTSRVDAEEEFGDHTALVDVPAAETNELDPSNTDGQGARHSGTDEASQAPNTDENDVFTKAARASAEVSALRQSGDSQSEPRSNGPEQSAPQTTRAVQPAPTDSNKPASPTSTDSRKRKRTGATSTSDPTNPDHPEPYDKTQSARLTPALPKPEAHDVQTRTKKSALADNHNGDGSDIDMFGSESERGGEGAGARIRKTDGGKDTIEAAGVDTEGPTCRMYPLVVIPARSNGSITIQGAAEHRTTNAVTTNETTDPPVPTTHPHEDQTLTIPPTDQTTKPIAPPNRPPNPVQPTSPTQNPITSKRKRLKRIKLSPANRTPIPAQPQQERQSQHPVTTAPGFEGLHDTGAGATASATVAGRPKKKRRKRSRRLKEKRRGGGRGMGADASAGVQREDQVMVDQ